MRWKEKGGAKLIALAVVSTIAAAGGGLAFVLVHPVGKKALQSFLLRASGRPPSSEEPPAEEPPPKEVPPPGTGAAPSSTRLAPEVAAALARAREAVRAKDFGAAEAAARKALALDPACAEASEILEAISQRRVQGEELRRKIAHDEAVKAAKEFLADGDLDRAAGRVERALAEDPTSAEALALRDRIAAERKRIAADDAARRARANDLAREGNDALVDGDYKRALELARKALELEPGNVAADNLRVQAESAGKRAAAAAARPPPAGEVITLARPDAAKPEAPGGPVEVTGGGKVVTLERPDAGPVELPSRPVELERPPDAPGGPLSVDAPLEASPAGPVSVTPAPAPGPQGPALPQRAVMAVLAELDRAMEAKDVGALERLLSERAGGILTGGRATRAQEIDNARAFFAIASGIKVERTTKPADVRVDALTGEARSSYRISYRIRHAAGVTEISRAYRALYRVTRERGTWRIASVVIEEERP